MERLARIRPSSVLILCSTMTLYFAAYPPVLVRVTPMFNRKSSNSPMNSLPSSLWNRLMSIADPVVFFKVAQNFWTPILTPPECLLGKECTYPSLESMSTRMRCHMLPLISGRRGPFMSPARRYPALTGNLVSVGIRNGVFRACIFPIWQSRQSGWLWA